MSDNNMKLSPQEMNFLSSLPKKPSQLDKETMMVSEIHNLVAALVNNDPKLDELIQIQPESATKDFNSRAAALGLPEESFIYTMPIALRLYGSRLSKPDSNSFLVATPNIGNEPRMVAKYLKDYLVNWNSKIYSGQTTPDGTIIPILEDSLKAKIKELEENSARFFCYAKDKYPILKEDLDDLVRFFKFEVSRSIESLQEKNAEYSLNWIEKRFSTVYDKVAQIDCSDLTANETIAFRTKQVCRDIAELNRISGVSLDESGDFEDSIAAYVRKRMQHELDVKNQAQYILDKTKESTSKDMGLIGKPLDILGSIKAKMAAFRNTSAKKNAGPSGPN